MRSAVLIGIIIASAPQRAEAQTSAAPESPMSRLEVGVHAALEAPIGQINGGNPLNEVVSRAHALGVEVGYRVLPRLYVGVSGQYDFANAVDTPCFGCGYSIRNGAHFIRIETNAEYRFVRSGAIRPWIGSGLGYEILFVTHSFLDQVNSDRWRGIEFLTVAGGVDFRPVERIWV